MKTAGRILTVFISLVWLVNGLVCKVLGFVPRHEMIVARILGNEYAYAATKFIGVMETLMFVWVISRIQKRLCAVTQIILVAAMNLMEFILVPDLLLFGKFNSMIAFLFICLIYYNEFVLNARMERTA
jgi:hypothetical protein